LIHKRQIQLCSHPVGLGQVSSHAGFTLLELLIVMSVIGLLSALAMPVYQSAQARSQRQLAKLALMKSAQWLEQAATSQGSYPASLPTSVWQTSELKYRISVSSQSQTYVLTATPVGNQQADDCGSLTLNQSGQRSAQGDTALCWSK
jgi:type IV pilus assembly protein PilE